MPRLLALLLLLAAGLARPATTAAQDTETGLLRDAAAREAAGDLAAAESLLRSVLEERAASVPALLSLERVLRIQARLDDLVPVVRRALEEEPRSALLNQLLVRTHAALRDVDGLERSASAWIAAMPEIEIPYRELARIWVERDDLERARSVLEEGRRRIGRDDALALELGDLYAQLGERDRAVREWERAIGPDARGLSQVRRRIRALDDGGAGVLPALVERLASDRSTPARLRAAVDLAIDAGLEPTARAAAERVLPELDAAEVEPFLIDVARRADGARLTRLAYWAYTELSEAAAERAGRGRGVGDGSAGGRLLAIENRRAELALELGDTVDAAAGYEAMEAAFERGSPQRRQAAALRIELMASQGASDAAESLRLFRAEYPDASETDRLTAMVAGALVEGGLPDEAGALLVGVRGPHSSLLRARMALSSGEVDAARLSFMSAASGLHGAEATRALSLATLLNRVSERAAPVLGEAIRLEDAGEVGAAVDRVEGGLPSLPAADRPPLLELAAEMADAGGLAEDARRLRRRVVAEHPRANEAPAALLELARGLRKEPGGALEARELLERLIIEYPRSALAPQARRELEELERSAVPGPSAQERQHP